MIEEIQYTLVGVVFDEAGKVLLTLRHDDEIPEADHKWQLSGGVLKFGETAADCLVREFREETGYVIKPHRLINLLWSYIWEHTRDGGRRQVIVLPFYCLKIGGIMQPSDPEILDIKWFNLKDIDPLASLPGICDIVEYAVRYRGVEKRKGSFFRYEQDNL